MRASSMFTQRNFWASIPLSLEDVAARLAATFGLVDPDFGTDVSEEWFEGFASDGLSFYVYRQGGIAAPLRFIIKPYPKEPSALGHRLASCFGQPISYGDVTNLGDKQYQFSELSKYDTVARS
jgi:hypothetical protein